jgi:hypothetical protein
VYEIPNQQLLVIWSEATSNFFDKNLLWLANDGSVQREAKVILAGYRAPMADSKAIPLLSLPAPIGWLFGCFAPVSFSQEELNATYAETVST